MKTFKVETEVKVYPSINELSSEDQNLVKEAREAAKSAYAPYSHFNVGAALLLENGVVVKGNNQENAAYPSGICAERVAVFAAGANYPHVKIKTMAVTAFSSRAKIESPITPCGACRQVLSEYETKNSSDIKLILCADCDEIWVLESVKSNTSSTIQFQIAEIKFDQAKAFASYILFDFILNLHSGYSDKTDRYGKDDYKKSC